MSHRLFAIILVAASAACSSGGTDDDNNNNNGGGGSLSATIDGTPFTALGTSSVAQISDAGDFAIVSANASGTGISLLLYNIGAPGTYPLGVSGLVFGGIATVTSGSSGWSTPLSGLAGSVTVTAVSATHIKGTFSFTATPLFGGAGASKTVTGGSFDLPVTGNGTITIPDQNGSTITGTFNGAPWISSTVVFGSAPSSGLLGMGIGNNGYNINLIISGFSSTGTYQMGTASGAVSRYLSITALDGTNRTWGFTNASTTGTFVVTTYTATRMAGTFNFTVAGSGGTTGSITFSGVFDVGFQALTGLRAER
jgi:hypothetical protein